MNARRSRIGEALAIVSFFALAGLLASAMALRPPSDRPRVSDGDVLETVFGGAREAFSAAMVRRADVYFHGGVEECGEGGGEESREHAHHEHGESMAGSFFSDPFRWIDSRVHSREHRHLEGLSAKEMMPFLWAAARANPHDPSVYSEAAYVAAGMMKDFPLALRILDEGIAANPGSVLLAGDRGRIFWHRLGDRASGEKEFRKVLAMTEGETGEASRRARIDAMAYLAKAARERGETESVRRFAEEARRLDPDYAGSHTIERILEECGGDGT